MKKQDDSETKAVMFTKEQYLALVKAVYLGNWVANAHRTGQKGDERHEEYGNISDYFFSLAPEFGLPKHLEHELEYDESGKTEIMTLIDEYDEETFWDELSDRLGGRDFFRKYNKEDWDKMSEDERYMKEQDCIIEWEEEFEKHGLEQLGIKD